MRYQHLPTGLAAESCEGRSRLQNEQKALGRLRERLTRFYENATRKADENSGKLKTSDELVRTYNQPDNWVLDHHSGLSLSFKATVGKKDIGAFIRARLLRGGVASENDEGKQKRRSGRG